jgi:RNA polymerase sigma-70 factor (ECF subfamily)
MADEGEGKRPALRVVPGGSARRRQEGALLAAFLIGDDEAFGELVREHEKLVLSLVRRYARTPEDARDLAQPRDLAQRTFLRAFEAARRALRHAPQGTLPFRRWLIRIAVNLAKNHLRDETRFRMTPIEDVEDERLGSQPAGSAELERKERSEQVRRAVLDLPRRQREVLTLRVDAELPFAEIAESLSITENAARVSFHHAVQRLRKLIEEESP